jgi:hypothetical protein
MPGLPLSLFNACGCFLFVFVNLFPTVITYMTSIRIILINKIHNVCSYSAIL